MNYTINTLNELQEFNEAIQNKDVEVINFISANEFSIKVQDQTHTLICCKELLNQLDFGLDKTTKLIYGKNPLDRIVNISYKNDNIHIFREVNGNRTESILPYRPWILSPIANTTTKKLDGNRHYKHIKFYENQDVFEDHKQNIYKHRLFTINDFAEAFMSLNGYSYFKQMRMNEVSVVSFDIETSGLDPLAKNAKVFLITNYYRNFFGEISKNTFNIDNYKSSYEMVQDWCNWIRLINPSLMIAHNGLIFDLPYLYEIANHELKLGVDNSNLEFEDRVRQKRKDGSQSYSYRRASIFGREIIDTFFLMLTADVQRQYESYALKTLIKAIGQEKEGRTYIDPTKISEYWNNPIMKAKVIQYAEEDAEDSLKLFDKFATPYFYFTQHVPKSFQMMMETATGGQINSLLVRSYLQEGKSIPKADDISEEKVEGGISFAVPGIYKNVLKLDIKSAYPSQVLRLKLYNKYKDPEANFYNITHYFAHKRFEYKQKAKETGDQYWKDLDGVNKIIINSVYGVANTSGLNFNDCSIAQTITKETREVIDLSLRWASGLDYTYWINKFYEKTKIKEDKKKYLSLDGKYVAPMTHDFIICPSDTDSISFCKQDMTPFSTEEIEQLNNEINTISPEMIIWENDGYYDSCLSLKAKNYVLKQDKKYTKKGSALKSSKLEPILKELLDELIKDSLEYEGKHLKDIYHNYIKKALNPTDISKWCQKKTVTKPVLACEKNKEARKNESDIWDAIKGKNKQEGDKIYLYPTVIRIDREESITKKGVIKIKEIPVTGLKEISDYNNDVHIEKLIERVYSTVCVLGNVVEEDFFIDYGLVKNKHLLKDLE